MLDSIKITKFKAIAGTIGLKKLKRVNYLVGENGSGKSSVLEAIQTLGESHILGEHQNQIQQYASKNYGDQSKSITTIWSGKSPKHIYTATIVTGTNVLSGIHQNIVDTVDEEDRFPSRIKPLKWRTNKITFQSLISLGHIDLSRLDDVYWGGIDKENRMWKDTDLSEKLKTDIIEFYNEFFSPSLTHKLVEVKKRLAIPEKEEKELQLDFVFDDTQVVNYKNLASGQKHLLHLYVILRNIFSAEVHYLILIEEPESTLHPKYQKLLPQLLKKISSSQENVNFFIATHSPFVISAASDFDNQKVYVIKSGTARKSEGYSPKEARSIASSLLGAQVDDLAPQKVVIVEGQSTEEFLKGINERFYNQSIRFIVAGTNKAPHRGGDEAVVKYAELCEELSCKTAILFPGSKVIFLIDKPNKTQNDNHKYMLAVKNCKRVCGKRFIESNLETLEDGFPKSHENDVQTKKILLAAHVSSSITRKEFEDTYTEFKKVFD